MGTLCAIEASGAASAQAVDAAFAVLNRVERCMHPTRDDSDLTRLRNARTDETITIDPWTSEVLTLARKIHDLSGGLFDPCLPTRAGKLADIDLLSHQQVRCRLNVDIDLGGIAKGYAVDRAIDALQRAGCSRGLVNAGGDLRVFGAEPHSVLVRRGDDHDDPQPISLTNMALAVSNFDATHPPSEHQGYYVRVAERFAIRRFAAIQAREAAVADALTKCAFFCTDEELQVLLTALDANIVA